MGLLLWVSWIRAETLMLVRRQVWAIVAFKTAHSSPDSALDELPASFLRAGKGLLALVGKR